MAIDGFDLVVKQQIEECTGLPDTRFDAEISIGTYRINAIAVVAFTQRNAYMEDMFEDNLLTVAVQPSEYSEGILVGHEDLTIKLTERPYEGGKAYTKHYRAILNGVQDEKMEANTATISQSGLQDSFSISVVTFQLISSAAYDLMLREVGDTFCNIKPYEVLSYFLSKIQLKDRYSQTERVANIEIDNLKSERVYREIVIPEGTNFLAFPDYLQENYGIFPQGFGIFLKNQTWFAFAPYGLAKSDEDVRRLVVFNAPSSVYRSLERNFKADGKTITIIATGESKHVKRSDAEAINGGTGVKYASVRSLDGGTSSPDPAADPLRTPQDYMTEYRSSSYANTLNKTVTAKERFTDNPLQAASALAARGGDLITVTWEGGTLDVLVPGMPLKYYYGLNGKAELLQGTLIGAVRVSSIPLQGIIEPRHKSMISMTLWVKR